MKFSVVVLLLLCALPSFAQRSIGGDALMLDNRLGKAITIIAQVGLPNSYTWTLPLFPPPANTAFTQAGALTGQMLRWDHALGYWVPTIALFAGGNTLGSFVGIGTTTPSRLLDISGVSGTPSVRIQSLAGTTNWALPLNGTDGLVLANNSGDLIKRDPVAMLNQYSWLLGGSTNPSSSIFGTTTNHPIDVRTNGQTRMMIGASGDISIGNSLLPSLITLAPGEGGNLIINDVVTDNTTAEFLTVDGINRVRRRTLNSILVPDNSDLFTLGTSTNRWKDLYLGPSSLHIGDDTLEVRISFEPSVGELRFNTNGIGAIEATMYTNGDVAIANLSAGGLIKAAPGTGILSVASDSDFESPLAFDNGLTRTTNTIQLGGALTSSTSIPLSGFNYTLSGSGRVGIGTTAPANKFAIGASSQFQVDSLGTIAAATGITSSGNIQFTGLGSGIVKSTGGTLAIATSGTDYEPALMFDNGLTRISNTIKLGGALTAGTALSLSGFNFTFTGNGNIGIGDATPASLFTVGSDDLFQVNTVGDLIKIKNVTYTWPSANTTGVLTNNGSGALSWSPLSAICCLNGQTGASQTFATSSTGSDFSISSTSNVHIFNLPDASATARGVLSTSVQTLGGSKTFSAATFFENGITISNGGSAGFKELSSNGFDSIRVLAPASLAGSYLLQLPANDGDNGQVLQTDGAGVLSWGTLSASAGGSSSQVQYNNSGVLAGSTNFIYNGTTLTVLSSGNALSSTTSSTTDEEFAVRGTVSGASSNQVIGVWGDAPNTNASNTGTIGVLATGNGNTSATTTNIAAQLNDGEFTMGRTTETTGLAISIGSIALAEGATGGSTYTAQGPSGVVEVTGLSIGVANAQAEDAGFLTIPNRYVNTSSIIAITIFDATASAGANEFSFSTQIRARDDDSFDVRVNVIKSGITVRTLTGYKLGYMILNPSR